MGDPPNPLRADRARRVQLVSGVLIGRHVALESQDPTNIKLCGSHAGVSIGEDGPSQMALEDIGNACAPCTAATVLYPCDANQTAEAAGRCMADAATGSSIYAPRGQAMPVIYGADEEFEIGGSRVIRSSRATTRWRSSPRASPWARRSRPPPGSKPTGSVHG